MLIWRGITNDIDDPVGRIHTPLGRVGDTLMAMVQIARSPGGQSGLLFSKEVNQMSSNIIHDVCLIRL